METVDSLIILHKKAHDMYFENEFREDIINLCIFRNVEIIDLSNDHDFIIRFIFPLEIYTQRILMLNKFNTPNLKIITYRNSTAIDITLKYFINELYFCRSFADGYNIMHMVELINGLKMCI